MAQYENLKAAVADVIKQNGVGYITGERLQTQLFGIINNVGKYATFAGVVQPNGSPVAHDGPTFYLTGKPGTYANFGGVKTNGISVITNQSGEWVATSILDTSEYTKTGGSTKTTKEVDDDLVQLADDVRMKSDLIEKSDTNFFGIGKNLFNNETYTPDAFIDQNTGFIVTPSSTYWASDYIKVQGGLPYYGPDINRMAWYDANKVYISGAGGPTIPLTLPLTAPANAEYIRFSCNNARNPQTYQFEQNTEATSYEPFYERIQRDSIAPWIDGVYRELNGKIEVNDLDILGRNKNLFIQETVALEKYVDWNNGLIQTNLTYNASDFMPVEPDTDYFYNRGSHYALYDENKVFIEGKQGSYEGLIHTPVNAAFARISVTPANMKTAQFEKGSLETSYVKGVYVHKPYIASDTTHIKSFSNKYPYSKDFPFNQEVIDEGADKFLIDAYLDIPYELGFDYSIAIAYKSTKQCRFYKHDSSVVPVTADSITLLGSFDVDYEIGRFTVMKPHSSNVDTLKNSVLVVDWNAISADVFNKYAYHGVGISPICFFNDLLARRLETTVTALSGEVSALDFKFSQVFEFEIENQITWPSNTYTDTSASSTFSGWGCKIGAFTGFNYAEVWVKNRDVTPITQLRIAIVRNSGDGEILADKTITVNVAPEAEQKIGVIFDSAVNNPEGDVLHLMYWCNKLVTRKGYGGTYPYKTNEGYSGDTYAAGGNMTTQIEGVGGDYPFYFKIGTTSSDSKPVLTDEQIDNIEGRLDLPTPSLDISLPDKLYAIVGDKLQLFFRGMIKDIDIYKYDILVTCSRGQKYPRYFEFTPVLEDVGTHNFKIEVKDKDGIILGSKTCQIIVRQAVQSPATNTVFLNVGDSLTTSNIWGIEAHRRLTGTGGTPAGLGLNNISFRGRKTGSGIGWEGNGGWTWSLYASAGLEAFRFDVSGVVNVPSISSVYTNNGQTFTVSEVNITSGSGYIRCLSTGSPLSSGVLTKTSGGGDATINFSASTEDSANPFWNNGGLDFPNYVNTYMDGQVDCIFFLLTWNGQTPHRTDFSSLINTAKILVDHIHTNYPDCKMKVMGVQVPSLNGGMGYSYGAKGTSYADGYGMVVTALNMNKAYQDWCNDPAYSPFLEFVNVSSQFDSENNMPEADTPVNSRSTKTEKRGTNGVHPHNDGYLQIGDVQFRNIVANYCQ